jgi:hypothetical protein
LSPRGGMRSAFVNSMFADAGLIWLAVIASRNASAFDASARK